MELNSKGIQAFMMRCLDHNGVQEIKSSHILKGATVVIQKTGNVAPSELNESSRNFNVIAKACVCIGDKSMCTHPEAFIQSMFSPSKYALRCSPCKEGNSIYRCLLARMEKPEGENKMEK